MKLQKEIIPWALIFSLASIGFFLLLNFTPAYPDGGASANSHLFKAGPAYCASLALASLFLLSRFLVSKGKNVTPTSFRHVLASTLLSLAGVITWEFSQMFLIERQFVFTTVLGALGGSLTIFLFWLYIKTRGRQKDHTSSLS